MASKSSWCIGMFAGPTALDLTPADLADGDGAVA
jgi:hypothetical protein